MAKQYPNPEQRSEFRLRLAALALVLAGIFFVLYPAIRPFSDEASLQGASAFASTAWVLAHSMAMVGFILMMLGLLGLYARLRESAVERLALLALLATWIGIGLTLPYYGAETFGLHAIGQQALQQNDPSLLSLANSVRYGPGIAFFGTGLILLAAGAVLFAAAVWRSRSLPRWGGIPFAAAFLLFIPQFFTPQIVRVLHGVLIAVGCIAIAWNIWFRRRPLLQGQPQARK